MIEIENVTKLHHSNEALSPVEFDDSNDHLTPADHLLGTPSPIDDAVFKKIVANGRNISSFGAYMGDYAEELNIQREKTALNIPESRREIIDVIPETLETIPTLYQPLSIERINPETVWEGDANGNKPDLFFGMGGGSTSIIRAASLDAFVMFFTAESLRRKLGLGKARAILANRITFTNLPYSPDFLPEGVQLPEVQQLLKEKGPHGIEAEPAIQRKINNRMRAEREIYTSVLTRMGIDMGNWDIFLQTDMEDIIGTNNILYYEQTISAHNQILHDITGLDEYHYSQEDGIIDVLVNQSAGGVKLGWWIRNLDKVNGGYIMDEQPFHLRWVLGQALREDTKGENKVSLFYALAAPRLYPDAYGNLRKASPYICYDPEDMITLHPDEDIVGKFRSATNAGGGLHREYSRKYYSGIVSLFEELTGVTLDTVSINDEQITIDQHQSTFEGEKIALKVQAMRDWILEGSEDTVKGAWKAFEEDSPQPSTGLPMKLPVSPFYVSLGIQPDNLYYRVKGNTYDEETFKNLNQLYHGDTDKMDFTRDMFIIASFMNDRTRALVEKTTKAVNIWRSQSDYFTKTLHRDDPVRKSYRAGLEAINYLGINTKIELLNSNSQLYPPSIYYGNHLADGVGVDTIIQSDASYSGLHINPDIAEYISAMDQDDLEKKRKTLEAFLTIVSYPDSTRVKEKVKEYGYSLDGISDEGLRTLQTLAEDYFEGKVKGSTPRKKWREIYT